MVSRTACASRLVSRPNTETLPAVGVSMVAIILSVVDLPTPLGPTRAKISPGATLKSSPATASKSLYFLTSPVISSAWVIGS